jgi:hypothetical protein
MSVSFHPGEMLREKVRRRVENLKTMDKGRVGQRASGRVLCTLTLLVPFPLAFFAIRYGYFHENDRVAWICVLAAAASPVLLLVALKQFGGQRGILWGAWLCLLSFSKLPLFLGGGFLLAGVVMLITKKEALNATMLEILAASALLALLGYYGHRHLERIEMEER